MNNFEKAYFEIILEENNMISEGKFLNNLMAGVGGLAMTGGSVFGADTLSKMDKPETNNAPIIQTVKQSDAAKNTTQKINLTEQEYFVARVLYSETSTKATVNEIKMVCQIIVNRIGNRDFGGGKTPKNAFDVVSVKNVFSCINDSGNSNWEEFKPDLNERTKLCCKYAKLLMKSNVKQIKFFNDKSIVYYHDLSISTPKKWTNKYWRPVLKYSTKNFKFYSIKSNVKSNVKKSNVKSNVKRK